MAPLGEAELAAHDPKDLNYRITILEEEMAALDVSALLPAGWLCLAQEAGAAWGWARGVPACASPAPRPHIPGACLLTFPLVRRRPPPPPPPTTHTHLLQVDLEAIEKWRTKDAEYADRVKELEAATAERDEVRGVGRRGCAGGTKCSQRLVARSCLPPAALIRPTPTAHAHPQVRREHEELRKRRLDEFMAGFNVIGLKLKEMYQMITLGGDAELELVDSLDPFSGAGLPGRTGAGGALRAARALACWLQPCHHAPHPTPCARAEGILFSVRPPKKSWKNIANLSGGEKTLSSLSLVFALHHYKPTPLYVMDEIDAALGALRLGLGGGTVGLPGQHGRGQRGRAVAPLEGANGGPAATHHLAPPPSRPGTARRLQERVHRGALHQGAHQERPVCHHLAAQQHV